MRTNYLLESQRALIDRTVEATGSSKSTIKRIINENKSGKLQSPGKKRPNRKKFNKLDSFDLSVIRRIVHEFYGKNESPTLKKLLKKLKNIDSPYGMTQLYKLLKMLGFRYKRKGRKHLTRKIRSNCLEGIIFKTNQRNKKKGPTRELVYTDETSLNGEHRVKKEWVDLKALENASHSIQVYGREH